MSNEELIKDPVLKGKYQFEIEWPDGGRSVAGGDITGEQFKQVWAILFPETEKPISGIEMQYFQDVEGKIPATEAGQVVGLVKSVIHPLTSNLNRSKT